MPGITRNPVILFMRESSVFTLFVILVLFVFAQWSTELETLNVNDKSILTLCKVSAKP